jgi:MFS family permease
VLVGIGIGLASPTLGAAAAADIPPERFGVAAAVTGVGRQVGAVLGTALLIAIVGDPQTLVGANEVADDAYVYGIVAALLSGAVAMRLVPARRAAGQAGAQPAAPAP